VLPWFLAWMGFLIFDPDHRRAEALRDSSLAFWLLVVHVFAVVTAIFIVVERRQRTTRTLERWNAHTLLHGPPARDPRVIPRSESIVELVFGAVFLWCWLGVAGVPQEYQLAEGVKITFWPLGRPMYWLVVLLLASGVAMACANLTRPWWTRSRALVQAAIDSFGLVLVGVIAAAGPILAVASIDQPARARALAWLNLSWTITLVVIGGILLVRVVQSLRRARA
jgi:hypothetical protein